MLLRNATFALTGLALILFAILLSSWPEARHVSASGASAVSAGSQHSCALISLGRVQCWGRNLSGQLGNDSTFNSTTPVDVCSSASCVVPLTGATRISAGSLSTCALVNGGVKCWGDNFYGQLGDGTNDDRHRPVDVSGLTSGVSTISAGFVHACAVTADTKIGCWGDNSFGQLGNASTMDSNVPVTVCRIIILPVRPAEAPGDAGLDLCFDVTGFADVAAGENHTCALTTQGEVRCWGLNNSGQLGDGTTDQHTTPVEVCGDITCTDNLTGVVDVSAGSNRSCALMASGGVKCWGNFPGDGTFGPIGAPVDVCADTSCSSSLSNATAISAGGGPTCVVIAAGGVECWGTNNMGQLGNDTTDTALAPVSVCAPFIPPLPAREPAGPFPCLAVSGYAAVSAGDRHHTCGVTTASAVRCWGRNEFGQLGATSGEQCLDNADLMNYPCSKTPLQVSDLEAKPTPTPTDTPTGPQPTATNTPSLAKPLGDVNDDGQVSAVDAALILQLSAGLVPSLLNEPSADVDLSGGITAVDAALILQFVAGLIPGLPP
ncbi:MAG: dockerin type I domain-containing protein [Dehalococcoidia bacterium]|nr:dockerin type I domain-containing protein [Dehalococcoidia bacterium]